MERDDIEKIIIQHRSEFDLAEPPAALWSKIAAQLDPPRAKVIWMPVLRRVAAVAALLVIGFGAGVLLSRSTRADVLAEIQQVNPDFSGAERYYSAQIRHSLERLNAYPSQKKEVLQDLAQLDQISQELLRDLASAPAGAEDRIVAELIQTYRTKVSILEKVLDSIHASKSKTKSIHHEKEI